MMRKLRRLKLRRRRPKQVLWSLNTSTSSSVTFGPQMALHFRFRFLIQKVGECYGCQKTFNNPSYQGIASLETLMREFSIHHRSTSASPPGFVPKAGDLVSAKFSDGAWYRAKIRRSSPLKKEAEVTFIDYGNQDTVAFTNIRPLDPKFRSLPGQAHEARLRQISFLFSFIQFC